MHINQIIGFAAGIMAGISWEHISNAKFKDSPTFLKSIFWGKFHPHHWLIYATILILIFIWSYKHNKLTHPSVIMIIAFFGSAILYGFIFLKGWGDFFK